MNIEPVQADYDELWKQFPIAAERIKVIVLSRMIAEKDVKLAEMSKPSDELEE